MTTLARHVLLVGGHPDGTLRLCRWLARSGHRVTLLRWDEQPSFADASRYCSGSVWLGAVDAGVAAWGMRVTGLLQSGAFTHLWPVDALAHEMLCTHTWHPPREVSLIGPTADAFAGASDRCEARTVARGAGLSVLQGHYLQRGSRPEPIDLASMDLPCVARPRRGAGLNEDESALYSTRHLADLRALDNKLRDDLPRVGVLLQASPRGERLDICLAAVAGKIESVSAPLRPPLLDAMRLMLGRLNWTGLLQVECRQLAGATVFVDLHFGLDGWTRATDAAGMAAIRALAGSGDSAVCSAIWGDPVPAVARLVHRVGRTLSKMSMAVRAGMCALPGTVRPRPLRPADSILFVCKGNINRSLVAEQTMRRAGFQNVASAALIGMAGRRPSRPAEQYVREVLRLPTEGLHSRSLRQGLALLKRIDRVVCFERRQVIDVLRRHPELRGRIHLLTTLAGDRDGPLDIADPHGKDDDCHRRCFERISVLLHIATIRATPAPSLATDVS